MESPHSKDIPPQGIIKEEPQEDVDLSPSPLVKAQFDTTSGKDSQGHTKNDPEHPRADIKNPILVDKPITTGPTHRKRRSSLPNINNLPNLIPEEELAVEDMEPRKLLKIKQIKSLRDQGEFNTRDSHRKLSHDPMFHDERAHSFERGSQLEKVQEEAKNEEEKPVASLHSERKWKILKDCDEFNFKEKLRKAGESTDVEKAPTMTKKKTFSLNVEDDPIPEEEAKNEHGRGRQQHHLHSNSLISPKTKLKVDEIDFERKKSEFDKYETEIELTEELTQPPKDIIKEDASEENQANQAEEILERAKHKMHSEKDFIKKFLKSESSEELDRMRLSVDREGSNTLKSLEEQIEDDAGEEDNNEKPTA